MAIFSWLSRDCALSTDDAVDDARHPDELGEGPAFAGFRPHQQDRVGVHDARDPCAAVEPTLAADAAPILSLYPHNAASFTCASCEFVSQHLQELRRQRQSRHRRDRYDNRFFAQCACGASFSSRAATTSHLDRCHSVVAFVR